MAINLAFVHGTLSSPPEIRTLASGDRLASLQLTVRRAELAATSVPVAIVDPPAWVEGVAAGDEIAVLGTVRRRFFRAGGATASRFEIAADHIARGNDRRAIGRLLRRASDQLAGS